MRIISQDGTLDVPYEQVVIQRFNQVIYFLNKNLTGVESIVDDIKMASYSTEEKAQKAMKMLRKEYQKFQRTSGYGYYFAFDHPKVFQFPKDDEVEE